jgi:hypothetical protein
MKHGDKEKGKPAKAVSKTSGKKGGEAGAKAGAGGKGGSKIQAAAKSIKAEAVAAIKKVVASKTASKEDGGNGSAKNRAVEAPPPGGFTNPAVAAGYKRALKKYPNAFRKLTD